MHGYGGVSPSKSDEGRDLQATGFSGHSFAKLRLLKNNIQCVRVSLPLIASLTCLAGFFQLWESQTGVL